MSRVSSETRTVFPYQRGDLPEDAIKFRSAAAASFAPRSQWAQESPEFSPEDFASASFAPEFLFDLDAKAVAAGLSLAPADLVLSILVEDPAAWMTQVIEQWPLSEVPTTYAIPKSITEGIAGNKGLSLTVQVSPAEAKKNGFQAGDRVAQIQFDLRSPSDGNEFPTTLVEDAEFTKRGLPASTVWVIDWKSDDFDIPVEDALVVMINKASYGKLAMAQGGFGQLLWHTMACEILTEIALRLLRSDPTPFPPKTLGQMVVNALNQGSGKALEALVQEAKSPQAFFRIRAYVQAALMLKDEIGAIRVRGSAA